MFCGGACKPIHGYLMELACDASMKNRRYDADGQLHILRTPISKATVNPYYGKEIPNAEALGLAPDRVYYLLRDPGELAKAAPSFERKPLMNTHTAVSAEEPKQDSIAGTIGSDVSFEAPYLIADIAVWDVDAIAGIETDTVRELSCSYRYRADMTPGMYEGQRYDGVMRDIQGNHVALVKVGRAGSDVMAADSRLEKTMETKFGKVLYAILRAASPKLAKDESFKATVIGLTPETATESLVSRAVLAMDAELDKKIPAEAIRDAKEVSGNDAEEEEKKAKDRKAKDGRKRGKDMDFEEWAQQEEDETEGAEDRKKARDAEEDDEDRAKREEHKKKAEDAKKVARDSFDDLVGKLEKKGYSKEYATKVAGKVAAEKGKDAKDWDYKDGERFRAEDRKRANDMKHAMDEFREELRSAEKARRDVRGIVGDVLAIDSAEQIYAFALDEMKIDHAGVKGADALRALFSVAKERRSVPALAPFDRSLNLEDKFSGANRKISVM